MGHSERRVRGNLFLEYVRAIRAYKSVDWRTNLDAKWRPFVEARIDVNGWYPMDAFEQLGLFLLDHTEFNDEAIRVWGRSSAGALLEKHRFLLAEGDPVETVIRFRVMRGSFFDFDPVDIESLDPISASVTVAYGMSDRAERAAFHQTMGFFEGVLDLSRVEDVTVVIAEKAWEGADRTLVHFSWKPPR
ncbi:MAG: hypothetical protein AAGF12_31655 [Myxococcota bacterium]